jgi:hypothetical protein
MNTNVRATETNARNPAAEFRREILGTVAVENCGKKLPGYCFGRMAHALWPSKTAAAIEYYTGVPDRTARQHASGKSDPASAHLVAVLQSDQGWRALEWIMRGNKQSWWTDLQKHKRVGAAAVREIAQLEMQIE